MSARCDLALVFRPVRANGPALLVPAAWIVVAAATFDVVSTHALFVAHVVMSALLVAFVVASWRDMAAGVLRAWKLVILAGTPVTLAGVAGFLALGSPAIPPTALLAVSLFGWALLPAAGFVYTGRRVEVGARIYDVGAVCCVAGAVAVAVGSASPSTNAVGLALVAVGQTAGILDATLRY